MSVFSLLTGEIGFSQWLFAVASPTMFVLGFIIHLKRTPSENRGQNLNFLRHFGLRLIKIRADLIDPDD
jgi:hypothetical protein